MKITKDKEFYIFTGPLDEDSDLSMLYNLKEKVIKLDLEGVSSTNSLGLQKLAIAIDSWGDTPFEYHNINFEMANQVEMVKSLMSINGSVKSFVLPFACEVCATEESVKLTLAKLQKLVGADLRIELDCRTCGTKTIYEAMEDYEFAFKNSV